MKFGHNVVINFDKHHWKSVVMLTDAEATALRNRLLELERDGKIAKDAWYIDPPSSPYTKADIEAFIADN